MVVLVCLFTCSLRAETHLVIGVVLFMKNFRFETILQHYSVTTRPTDMELCQ